jgi:hypothetical protein
LLRAGREAAASSLELLSRRGVRDRCNILILMGEASSLLAEVATNDTDRAAERRQAIADYSKALEIARRQRFQGFIRQIESALSRLTPKGKSTS